MAMLSVRTTRSENLSLKALAQQHGFLSVSSYIRWKLDMPAYEDPSRDTIPAVEDFDLQQIMPLLIRQSEAVRECYRRLNYIIKQLGLPPITPDVQYAHENPGQAAGWETVHGQTITAQADLPPGFRR